jgi:predicted N-acetyltransferase YhbS
MEIIIRLETEKDHRETESLTRDAFWDVYKPGCDEHFLLHNMRKVPAFVKELDFVAVNNDRVIGNIIYTKAKVVNENGAEHEVLCMGPLSVLPSFQGKGVGAKLMIHSLIRAGELGYRAVIIFGNPGYYTRFGFMNAGKFNIKTSEGRNLDPFMALELYGNSLKGIEGRFHEDPVFNIDPAGLEDFEKQFPYREKHVTDTQLK